MSDPVPDPPLVLLLDGNQQRRRDLAGYLQARGYRIAEAGGAREAQALLAQLRPQALVLEHRLRDGSAPDVLAQLPALSRPFVVVHGDWPRDLRPHRPPGVDIYLAQPLLSSDLLTLLEAHVPLRRTCCLPTIHGGDHLALFFDSRPSLLDSLSAYVACGLALGERCVLSFPDEVFADEARACLERNGIDVERSERRRSLVLVRDDECYLLGGRFVPSRMLDFVRDLLASTLDDGFAGLRAAGGGSWVPATPEDDEAWFHWEKIVATLFAAKTFTGLCLYDRRRFDPGSLLRAVGTHPLLLDGRVVCENPSYPQFGLARASLDPAASFAAAIEAARQRPRLSTS